MTALASRQSEESVKSVPTGQPESGGFLSSQTVHAYGPDFDCAGPMVRDLSSLPRRFRL